MMVKITPVIASYLFQYSLTMLETGCGNVAKKSILSSDEFIRISNFKFDCQFWSDLTFLHK